MSKDLLQASALAQNLSDLHSYYGVYSSESLNSISNNNIVSLITKIPKFKYLANFYSDYIDFYPSIIVEDITDKRARSKDLFFIGGEVLKNNTLNYFFVFEGSLSTSLNLIITVLSHLWLLENDDPIINQFCGSDKWWTYSNYISLKRKLNIPSQFAQYSYVIDAIRLND